MKGVMGCSPGGKPVERSARVAHFAWDEFSYAELHNPPTQAAYHLALRRFLACAGN